MADTPLYIVTKGNFWAIVRPEHLPTGGGWEHAFLGYWHKGADSDPNWWAPGNAFIASHHANPGVVDIPKAVSSGAASFGPDKSGSFGLQDIIGGIAGPFGAELAGAAGAVRGVVGLGGASAGEGAAAGGGAGGAASKLGGTAAKVAGAASVSALLVETGLWKGIGLVIAGAILIYLALKQFGVPVPTPARLA